MCETPHLFYEVVDCPLVSVGYRFLLRPPLPLKVCSIHLTAYRGEGILVLCVEKSGIIAKQAKDRSVDIPKMVIRIFLISLTFDSIGF